MRGLHALLAAYEPDGDLPARRAAAVVLAWNVLQHFYPYFDVTGGDWDAELPRALDGALRAADEREFSAVLSRLAAALRDGHASIFSPALESERAGLPLALDWVEDAVVVVASEIPGILPGDEVMSLDDVPALVQLERDEELISGSPQWRRARGLAALGRGQLGSEARLRLRREGRDFEVRYQRDRERTRPLERRPDPIALLADGVYYVDLSRASIADFDARSAELAAASGVVFDLRGYPKANHEILSHLSESPLLSAQWNVPLILYPDRERIVGWDSTGRWTMAPRQPRLQGRIVFLTDARAISYAESIMGIVEYYRLGEIVGQATAGTNGNINSVRLPGGYQMVFTGMKVLKHDGSPHHLVGIQPTVPVQRTRAGIGAGRDELLEKALEVIRGGSSAQQPGAAPARPAAGT